MSIEYEVRSEDDQAPPVPVSAVLEILRRWELREGRNGLRVYDADQCHVEVSWGLEDADPNTSTINWVGLRVPAGAKLESADRAVAIAVSLAQGLGWRVFDPQSDRYLDPDEPEPASSLRADVARLLAEVRGESTAVLAKRLWLRARRQSLRSIGEIAFGAAVVTGVSGRLLGIRAEERLGLTLAIVAGLTAIIVCADIVLDVLGEIHAAAKTPQGTPP